jgi:hypothetical protein
MWLKGYEPTPLRESISRPICSSPGGYDTTRPRRKSVSRKVVSQNVVATPEDEVDDVGDDPASVRP